MLDEILIEPQGYFFIDLMLMHLIYSWDNHVHDVIMYFCDRNSYFLDHKGVHVSHLHLF